MSIIRLYVFKACMAVWFFRIRKMESTDVAMIAFLVRSYFDHLCETDCIKGFPEKHLKHLRMPFVVHA